MAKILDKKETVIDFQLTNYGKYLMSVGEYSPVYYAFYDDNIVYDNQYNNISESQNSINERIKDNTPYIGSLTLFEDVDSAGQKLVRSDMSEVSRTEVIETPDGRTRAHNYRFKKQENYFLSDITPTMYTPRRDVFRYGSSIGDALLDSKETDVSPAWKIIVLNGEIESSQTIYKVAQTISASIPQVNIRVNYKKEIRDVAYPTRQTDQISTENARSAFNQTPTFADNSFIYLTSEDPIIYVDEANTEMLSENYDVEVFMVTSSASPGTDNVFTQETLERKYFETIDQQIVNGLMVMANPSKPYTGKLPQTAVEYYFDFKKDSHADRDIVCRQLQNYNKTSYYIDLDIDCSGKQTDDVYFDIYGSQVEPEICLD